GPHGEQFRANDDGEPSGTAGKPILGQLLSHDITDCLIVVVRYFGGTKLGVSGLIQAYKEAAADVIAVSDVIEKTVDTVLRVDFSYMVMNDIMRIIKEECPQIVEQIFDNLCTMTLSIRQSKADMLIGKLSKVSGATIEIIENEL
ncbi:MAG: YigZ family protein, partial [Alistipes sp.]|nr:YigZ family protein [Alistipes sp.]